MSENALLFKRNVAAMKEAIDNRTAGTNYAGILANIKKILIEDSDVVTIASEEDIGIIVNGLALQKGLVLEAKASAKKQAGSGVKSLKNVSLDDI
jgi:hypothetical protein